MTDHTATPTDCDIALPRHPRALVLGATGGIGAPVARLLAARGWQVIGLARRRSVAAARFPRDISWIEGDAMRADDVLTAAAGCDVIVHAVNPPGYRNWRGLAIPMLANTIAAAQKTGASILLPGNVYNFGPDAGSLVDETAPQNPVTRKGRVRVEMETMLREAAERGVRSVVVRAGDFFGPGIERSWFSQMIAKDVMAPPRLGRSPRPAYPAGNPQAGHCWAYAPDLAETMVRVIERRAELQPFDVLHFGGHWIDPGIDMAHAAARAIGQPDLPVRIQPWWPIVLLAPFVTFAREMLEMRYLWTRPLRLDNSKLVALLGEEPHTPLDAAVHTAMASQCELLREARTAVAL